MKRKVLMCLSVLMATSMLMMGCGNSEATTEDASTSESVTEEAGVDKVDLEDGTYLAEFNTDSGMFHVNETCEGKGTLTVKDGYATMHVTLVSKNIVNMFLGTAEDAQVEGAAVIEPTTDEVTYSDGMTEEVYGFDIPVPAIGEEFDLAIIGTKEKWYDHKVSIDNPEKQ